MKRLSYLAAMSSISLALIGCGSSSDGNHNEPAALTKKNVILMITDGASDGAWDLASFWTDGALLNNTFPYNELDTRYAMATYALNGNDAPDTSETCSATEYAEGFGYVAASAADDTSSDDRSMGTYESLGFEDVTATHEKCLNPEEGKMCVTHPYGDTVVTLYGSFTDLIFKGYSYINKNYTDSAASGTAIATGWSTYNGAISMDNCGKELKIITQYAKEQGMATGIVSSVQFSHATPAVFGARNSSRSNTDVIGSDMLANGYADLIMGAGHPEYDSDGKQREASFNYIKQESWEALQAGELAPVGSNAAWALIDAKSDFEALANGTASDEMLNAPLFGLARNSRTLQQKRNACSDVGTAFACPMNDNVPDLSTMSKGALNYLSQNENGFFLMIEGGAVDWAAHANDTARIIEEQVDFNNAVAEVFSWVEENSSWEETLLIVTTDHGNSYVLGNNSDSEMYAPVEITAKETMPSSVKYYSGSHTNELVRLYAKGNGSDKFANYVIGKDESYAKRYRHNGADGSYFQNKHIFNVVKEVIEE